MAAQYILRRKGTDMKAVVTEGLGGPEVLKVRDIPKPAIRNASGILVRLKAAGVNPVDAKLRRRGNYFPDLTPAVPGCDGAGVVAEIGPGVKRFAVGDEVFFCSGGVGGPAGNYAEFAVVDERHAARKPKSLSFAAAAAAPLVLLTAWESLHDRGCIAEGMRVLVHAGAGGVGHVAVQIARLAGAEVCVTVGSEEKARIAASLGADRAFLYKKEDFAAKALNWSGGRGVDLAFDTVGGAVFQATFPAVKVYGDLVTILTPPRDVDWTIARMRNLRISLEIMLTPMVMGLEDARSRQTEILERCADLIDAGRLKVLLTKTFPLEEAQAAHRLIETGSTTGKLALIVGE
jgi:NADPH2:quinone reductase